MCFDFVFIAFYCIIIYVYFYVVKELYFVVIIMFNQNLRKIREDKRISQIEMAKILGIPVTTYRNYENTSRQPDFEVLVKMATTLGVSVDKLLGNTSDEGCYSDLFCRIRSLPKSKLHHVNEFIEFLIFKENNCEK